MTIYMIKSCSIPVLANVALKIWLKKCGFQKRIHDQTVKMCVFLTIIFFIANMYCKYCITHSVS